LGKEKLEKLGGGEALIKSLIYAREKRVA